MAGYIGLPREWDRLNKKWQALIRRYGVDEFHAHEFFSREENTGQRIGAYGNWTNAKSNLFIERLCRLIDDHDIYPVGSIIDVKAFSSLAEGIQRGLTGGKLKQWRDKWTDSGSPKPYHAAFQAFLADAAVYRDDDSTRIDFIFDKQTVYEGRAKYAFANILTSADPELSRFRSIAYDCSQEHPGLQASDLVTHCLHRAVEMRSGIDAERRRVFLRLMNKRNRMLIWDAKLLDSLLANIPEDYRERLAAMGTRTTEIIE